MVTIILQSVQKLVFLLLALTVGLGLGGCSGTTSETGSAGVPKGFDLAGNADQYLDVDCMLPGQVRKLGTMLYTSPRRPVKTTAGDCEIRGGEYVLFDRANYRDALAVWLLDAEAGDPTAQTYVGEIYQKSPPEKPRYDLAAKWFQKAADQGFTRAQVNLAYLFEHGLGVPADPDKAVAYYAKASGIDAGAIVQQYQLSAEERVELQTLKDQNKVQRTELQRARAEIASVKEDLASARHSFNLKNKELEKQTERIARQQQQIAGVEQQLAVKKNQNAQELQRRLRDLQQSLAASRQALQQEQKLAAQLQQEVARKQHEAESYQASLTATQARLNNLPGPKIEVLDPQLLRTRGIVVAPVEDVVSRHQIAGRVWSAAGLSELLVNGDAVQADADGRFTSFYKVKKEDQHVKILARDINGKQDLLDFAVQQRDPGETSPSSTIAATGESIAFGKYYALVIGNNHYRQLPPLKTAIDDAKAIARILEQHYGFKVTLLLDADRSSILSTLNMFRKELTEKDNFLIYYAGHGTLVEQNTEGFWLPVDSSLDNDVNWIPTERITGIMNLMAAKQIMVIADACYSGIMTRASVTRLETGRSEEAREKWLRKMAAYKSRVIISSGENKPVLDGGGGKHSVFASALIEQLEKNNGILLGIDLHRAIVAKVVEASGLIGMDQVPQYAGLTRAGHELGDFLFVPVSGKG